MKQLKLMLIILIISGALFGQNRRVTLVLASDSTLSNISLEKFEGDSLYVRQYTLAGKFIRIQALPVTQIEQIHLKETRIIDRLKGFILGGTVGALFGYFVWGPLAEPAGELSHIVWLMTGAIGSGVGSLVGVIVGSSQVPVEVTHDFSKMTTEEKKETIQEMVAKHKK